VVGYGTEEDDNWRTYHFDFCGHIDYDRSGAPIGVRPVGNSGYSLGMLQLDFGQTTAAAEPFISAFESWHAANPGSSGLESDHDKAVAALKSDGKRLAATPSAALHRKDVEALSAYVLTTSGSEWVNINVDCALIGSDAHRTSPYGEPTLMAAARLVEATEGFKSAEKAGNARLADLLYAMSMKGYNQGPKRWRDELLKFLDTDPSEDDIVAWANPNPTPTTRDDWMGGLAHAVADSRMWSTLTTATSSWKPPGWLTALETVMDGQAMTNPVTASQGSAEYVALRQVFESAAYFPAFAHAVQAGKDYIPSSLFYPKTGAIKVNPTTGYIYQGVMARNNVAYVWDMLGNAYQLVQGVWSPVAVEKINGKRSLFETIRSVINEMIFRS
jgi:hypothetical protein